MLLRRSTNSALKKEYLKTQVAFHPGLIVRRFLSGELKEEDTENKGETHSVIDVDNCRTLGSSKDHKIDYAEKHLERRA